MFFQATATHNPVNTKHLYNICTMLDQQCTMLDTLSRRCTNVIQMFCVRWELQVGKNYQ